MFHADPDFMNFIGCRESLIEQKVQECLAQYQHGERELVLDPGDLTSSEIEQAKEEIMRRIRSGDY